MAWARIDDGALTHPKIVGMMDYRDPFHLWIWGIVYTQLHLTDGCIPLEALPPGCQKARRVLEQRKLWDANEDGSVRIHDYLSWNDSRETVAANRSLSRERMRKYRQRTNVVVTPDVTRNVTHVTNAVVTEGTIQERSSANVPRGVVQRSISSSEDSGCQTNTRSGRPIFVGQRLTVFEWMFDDIRQILGSYLDDFNLDAWFYELDAKAMRLNLVIPKRDKGVWIQGQLIEEAKRRGLRIAGADDDNQFSQLPTAWHCGTCGELHEGTQEQRNKRLCLKHSA
jgi:hypothetical protein